MSNVIPILAQPVTHEWETPQALFDTLHAEFRFTVDAAANETNHKCDRWFGQGGEHRDGLEASWDKEVVWSNPPYGNHISWWVAKGFSESCEGATVVMLIPSRTDTAYWHDYVMRAAEIRFVRGRLRFSGYTVNAPFPSAVVVFLPHVSASPRISSISREGKS